MRPSTLALAAAILLLTLSACASPDSARPDASALSPLPATQTPHPPTATITATFPPIVAHTFTPTITPTPSITPTPTDTPTPTLAPTYAVLIGKVIPEKLSCRFGPGVMYLYKYGLFQRSTMQVIGRMEGSTWILVQASRGKNPCWVNGEMMEVDGDLAAVEPVDPHVVLAWSPYYLNALTGVSATRNGNHVTVFWNPLILRAGDDSEQVPYVVEAWVCIDGQIVFAPVGSYTGAATVTDEPGCLEPSHARVFAAEKHGYTPWIEVPWPPAEP